MNQRLKFGSDIRRPNAGAVLMTRHLHASPLMLLFFRIGIALVTVPILALTYAQLQPDSSAVTKRRGRPSYQRCPQCDAESLVLRHAAERHPAAQRAVHQHFRR